MTPNSTSSLVFDLADPQPRFEFSNEASSSSSASPTKLKKSPWKNGRGFGKLRSSKGLLGGSSNEGGLLSSSSNNSEGSHGKQSSSQQQLRGSPDKSKGSTVSTTSSTFDDSIFDDSFGNDSVFGGFNQKRQAQAASSPARRGDGTAQQLFELSTPKPGASAGGSTTRNDNSNGTTAASPTFTFSSPPTPVKGSSSPYSSHKRTTSNVSGYISEVSEFSFDRVTVTTNETSGRDYCTVASSNVSWNFFDETGVGGAGGMNGNGGDFVPYTGEMGIGVNGVMIGGGGGGGGGSSNKNDTLQQQRVGDSGTGNVTRKNYSSIALMQEVHSTPNGNAIDNISLSDYDDNNDIPLSGIVSDSNQSIISEISGDNYDHDDDAVLDANVRMHLQTSSMHGGVGSTRGRDANGSPERRHVNNGNGSSRSPPASPSRNSKATPSRRGGGANTTVSKANTNASSKKSLLQDFQSSYQEFKLKKQQEKQRSCITSVQGNGKTNVSSSVNGVNKSGGTATNTTAANTSFGGGGEDMNANVFQSILDDVCLQLGFCSWYFCGVDTTLKEGQLDEGTSSVLLTSCCS
eukprot:scaffold13344_cov215-Alexandrium_tamarense.AAC.9